MFYNAMVVSVVSWVVLFCASLLLIPAFRRAIAMEMANIKFKWCEKRIAWHKSQLEKLDGFYRLEQATKKLARARDKHYEKGGSPSDPDLPVLDDFYQAPSLDWLKDDKLKKSNSVVRYFTGDR